jgi:hypothetical protein
VSGDFGERISELLDRSSGGDLVMSVEVDQIYAHFQHEGLDFKHPRGGGALYLQRPIMDSYDGYLQRYADGVLDEDGGKDAMIEAAEDLAEAVAREAPVELGDLRGSAHPKVTSGDGVVYDRPPLVGRLSEDELKAKDKARDALEGALSRGERTAAGLNVIHHRGG